MARNVQHCLLTRAKTNKKDEFYTQLSDIEKELVHYEKHFIDKVVYCNCDDPLSSNFVKYFLQNFMKLSLRKLIASGFRSKQNELLNDNLFQQGVYSEFSKEFVEKNNNIVIEENLNILREDGDFRSIESIELLKQADIVVTNPPFSLFREYVEQLISYNKKFLIIGNVNAITYKEIFNLIQHNQAWLGIHLGRGISGFIVPDFYDLNGTEARIDKNGNRIVSTNNCLWLTNLDIDKRHEDIPLVKKYQGNENDYPYYDNYDAINVNRTKDIPSDYNGVMGVPITFLHKFNPEQFEIIKFRKGNDEKDLSINGKCPYFRILIRKVNIHKQ